MVFKYKATLSFKGAYPKGRFLIHFLNNKQVNCINPTTLLSFNKIDSSIQLKTIKIAQ